MPQRQRTSMDIVVDTVAAVLLTAAALSGIVVLSVDVAHRAAFIRSILVPFAVCAQAYLVFWVFFARGYCSPLWRWFPLLWPFGKIAEDRLGRSLLITIVCIVGFIGAMRQL